MLDFDSQRPATIAKALKGFSDQSLKDAALGLFSAMGYESEKTADFGTTPEQFIRTLEQGSQSQFNREKAEFSKWRECSFLFQLTNDEIPSLTQRQKTIAMDTAYAQAQMESFVFLALELTGASWSRSQLAAITRDYPRDQQTFPHARHRAVQAFLFLSFNDRGQGNFLGSDRPAHQFTRCQPRCDRPAHHLQNS